MERKAAIALVAIAMVAIIVAVDVVFLRHHFWARLAVNAGIVVVFAAAYVGFARRG